PDGARVALVRINEGPRPPRREGEPETPWPFQIVVRKVGADKPLVTIDVPCMRLGVCWSPDGKKLVAPKMAGEGAKGAFENARFPARTGQSDPLPLPAGTQVLDWSRDGKTFLVQEVDRKARKNRLGLASRGEQEVVPLCDLRRHALDHRAE